MSDLLNALRTEYSSRAYTSEEQDAYLARFDRAVQEHDQELRRRIADTIAESIIWWDGSYTPGWKAGMYEATDIVLNGRSRH